MEESSHAMTSFNYGGLVLMPGFPRRKLAEPQPTTNISCISNANFLSCNTVRYQQYMLMWFYL